MFETQSPIVDIKVLQEYYPSDKGLIFTNYVFQFRKANSTEWENIKVVMVQVDPPNAA